MSTLTLTKCRYFPICQGCSQWHIPYLEQKNLKVENLRNLFAAANLDVPPIEFLSCGEQGLRHRVDFTIQKNLNGQQMGFYDQDRNLLDIKICLQLSPQLQQLYLEFQSIQFPIKKGSVRLRVGPSGLKGAWLDFSNLDIKHLLEENLLLSRLLEKNIYIEIGQKGKKLQNINGALKLRDPEPLPWFETYDQNLKPIPLLGLISDFTQPSWHSTKAMVQVLMGWLNQKKSVSRAIEFGPGLGGFTLPMLAKNISVFAYESNHSATEYLKLNAEKNQLSEKLVVNLGDYQNHAIDGNSKSDLAFVNPPRSGLKKFTHEVIKANAKTCIYVSCFPESMVEDLKVFALAGYVVAEVKIVDQFPQTHHYESMVLLEKLF
jgi:23S rRNA (uracil1939-C5)-methyltransferase